MSTLQELSSRQMAEAFEAAVEKHIPLCITVRAGEAWANFHSRFLAIQDGLADGAVGRLLLEYPASEENLPTHEFSPAERISVTFKLRHHKHVFSAVVAGPATVNVGGGVTVRGLALVLPSKMQRVQRRAYIRADVPPNRVVRVSFWLGGREAEPVGGDAKPVWSGRVLNISAGGFQAASTLEAAENLEPGEVVGVRLSFGLGQQTVFADAQFRHADVGDNQAMMGFQFLGLLQTAQGREALYAISARVAEYQRMSPPAPHNGGQNGEHAASPSLADDGD